MRHFIVLLSIFIFVISQFISCFSHYDGKVQERDISLKLQTNLVEIELFIKTSGKLKQLNPISGIYQFKTPELRFQTPRIMGITLNDNIWDIPDFLIVKHGSSVISVLSCQQIWELKKDMAGYSILQIDVK